MANGRGQSFSTASRSRCSEPTPGLRQIIERGNALARGTRSFPAAERLITGPGASRGPLRTINISHSCLDVVEEVGRIFVIAVATGSQSEPGIIGQPYGLTAIA